MQIHEDNGQNINRSGLHLSLLQQPRIQQLDDQPCPLRWNRFPRTIIDSSKSKNLLPQKANPHGGYESGWKLSDEIPHKVWPK